MLECKTISSSTKENPKPICRIGSCTVKKFPIQKIQSPTADPSSPRSLPPRPAAPRRARSPPRCAGCCSPSSAGPPRRRCPLAHLPSSVAPHCALLLAPNLAALAVARRRPPTSLNVVRRTASPSSAAPPPLLAASSPRARLALAGSSPSLPAAWLPRLADPTTTGARGLRRGEGMTFIYVLASWEPKMGTGFALPVGECFG